jgi:hypothetical protein
MTQVRLILRHDGERAPGFCETHGRFHVPLTRQAHAGVSHVLVANCPSCLAEGAENPTRTLALQSIPRLAAGRSPVPRHGAEARVPHICLDALDLACYSESTGDAFLLRERLVDLEAREMLKLDSLEAALHLVGLKLANIPKGARRGWALAPLPPSLDGEAEGPVERLAESLGMRLSEALAGLCLAALYRADRKAEAAQETDS